MNKILTEELNKETKVAKKEKLIYLEIMRIIACFFVLFNHTGVWGYSLFQAIELNTFKYWLYLFLSIFCKFSVPLFFMISGALLLPKENESLKQLWKKIRKMLLILVIWSFLYYLYDVFFQKEKFNLVNFFLKLYTDNWNFSYWYIYCYIAFLISLPFLRTLVKSLENKYFYYMFGIAIVALCILPTFQYLLLNNKYTINSQLSMNWLTTNFVLFPCIGYFLEHRVEINKKHVIIALILNFLTLILSCKLSYLKTIAEGFGDEFFHNTFVIFNSVTIYMTVKYIYSKLKFSEVIEKRIISIGSCTFVIYLMHLFFMRRFNFPKKLFIALLSVFKEQMVTAFIFSGVVMFICCIVTLILKKIPIIKKLV